MIHLELILWYVYKIEYKIPYPDHLMNFLFKMSHFLKISDNYEGFAIAKRLHS